MQRRVNTSIYMKELGSNLRNAFLENKKKSMLAKAPKLRVLVEHMVRAHCVGIFH